MELKLLGISELVEDKELYPREAYGWQTAFHYASAMKAGAKFPPVTVAFFAGKNYLIDGKHRIEAYKMNKEKSVQCEVLKNLDRKKIYLEAIKRNIANGRPLTPYDKAGIIVRLRAMDLEDIQISEIVQVPFDKFKQFAAQRITSTITGEQVILKSPLKHFSDSIIDPELADSQGIYAATSQFHIVEQMIRLLESKAINTKNATLMNKLKMVNKLTREVILSTRKK